MPTLTSDFAIGQLASWLGALHDPDDYVGVVWVPKEGGRAECRVRQRDLVSGPGFVSFLRSQNAQGANLYGTLNPLVPHARSHGKGNVRLARVIQLDLDREGDAALARLKRELPPPTLVVRTSEGRYQVMWRLQDSGDPEVLENAMRGLAARYGADRAAVDVSRLFRLPGFVNQKHDGPVSRRIVSVLEATPASRATLEDFHAEVAPPSKVAAPSTAAAGSPPADVAGDEDLLRAWRGENPRHWRRPATASERDLYLAQRLLRRGTHPERVAEVMMGSPNRAAGAVKRNLAAYVERTLARARDTRGKEAGDARASA